MMRRIFKISIIWIGVVLLTSCGAKSKASSDWVYSNGVGTISEKGIYFFDERVLQLYDAEAGITVPLCQRAECTHADQECSAYYEALSVIVVPAENRLYLITDDKTKEFGEQNIFTCSYAGDERKLIGTISDNMQRITAACWGEEVLYLGYTNSYSDNLQELEIPKAGVAAYDIQSGRLELLWEEEAYEAQVIRLSLAEENLVMETSYSDLSSEERTEVFMKGDYQQLVETTHTQSYIYNKQKGLQSTDDLKESEEQTGWVYYPTNIANTVFYSYYEDGENHYMMQKQDSGVSMEMAVSSDFIPLYIGQNYVVGHFFGTEDGNGVFAVVPGDDFLKGDLSHLKTNGDQ